MTQTVFGTLPRYLQGPDAADQLAKTDLTLDICPFAPAIPHIITNALATSADTERAGKSRHGLKYNGWCPTKNSPLKLDATAVGSARQHIKTRSCDLLLWARIERTITPAAHIRLNETPINRIQLWITALIF